MPSKRSEIPRPKMNPDEATARGIVQNEGVLARRASDCILCRAPGHALYARLRNEDRRAPGVWNLLACSACGLVRLDPRPLPDEIGKLYHAYYTHAPSDPWSGVLFTWGIRRGARSVLAAAFGYAALATGKKGAAAGRILSRIGLLRDVIGATVMWLPASPRGRLLDVGCGGGVRESLERMGTPAPPVPVHK